MTTPPKSTNPSIIPTQTNTLSTHPPTPTDINKSTLPSLIFPAHNVAIVTSSGDDLCSNPKTLPHSPFILSYNQPDWITVPQLQLTPSAPIYPSTLTSPTLFPHSSSFVANKPPLRSSVRQLSSFRSNNTSTSTIVSQHGQSSLPESNPSHQEQQQTQPDSSSPQTSTHPLVLDHLPIAPADTSSQLIDNTTPMRNNCLRKQFLETIPLSPKLLPAPAIQIDNSAIRSINTQHQRESAGELLSEVNSPQYMNQLFQLMSNSCYSYENEQYYSPPQLSPQPRNSIENDQVDSILPTKSLSSDQEHYLGISNATFYHSIDNEVAIQQSLSQHSPTDSPYLSHHLSLSHLLPKQHTTNHLPRSREITGSSNDLQQLQHNLTRFTAPESQTELTHMSSTSSISRGTPYRPQYKQKRKQLYEQQRLHDHSSPQQQTHSIHSPSHSDSQSHPSLSTGSRPNPIHESPARAFLHRSTTSHLNDIPASTTPTSGRRELNRHLQPKVSQTPQHRLLPRPEWIQQQPDIRFTLHSADAETAQELDDQQVSEHSNNMYMSTNLPVSFPPLQDNFFNNFNLDLHRPNTASADLTPVHLGSFSLPKSSARIPHPSPHLSISSSTTSRSKSRRGSTPSSSITSDSLPHQQTQPPKQPSSLLDLLFNSVPLPQSYPPHHYLIISTVGSPLVASSLVLLRLYRYLTWIRFSPILIALSQHKEAVQLWWAEECRNQTSLSQYFEDNTRSYDLRNLSILHSFIEITQALSNGVRIILYDGSCSNVTSRTLLREFLTRLGVSYTIFWIETAVVETKKDTLLSLEKQYNKAIIQQQQQQQQQQNQQQQQQPPQDFQSLLEQLDVYQSFYQSLSHQELDEELNFQQDLLSYRQVQYQDYSIRLQAFFLLQQIDSIHHHIQTLDGLNLYEPFSDPNVNVGAERHDHHQYLSALLQQYQQSLSELLIDHSDHVTFIIQHYRSIDQSNPSELAEFLGASLPPNKYPNSECYCQLIDGGLQSNTYLITSWLLTKVVCYLLNLQTGTNAPLYFSRHGESKANVNNLVGTDFGLSQRGFLYAEELAHWVRRYLLTAQQQRYESKLHKRLLKQHTRSSSSSSSSTLTAPTLSSSPNPSLPFDMTIYCSTLTRAISTAKFVFDELSFGVIQSPYPEEYALKNSLYYSTNHHPIDHLPASHPYAKYDIPTTTLHKPLTEALFSPAEKAIRYRINVVKWRSLVEIAAGEFEGYSYQQIQQRDPIGYQQRNDDKLNYRYPSGESYKDVIDRLERVVFELERQHDSLVLVIAHQAVIRCILGFFLNSDLDSIPHIEVPLNTVIKVDANCYPAKIEYIKVSSEIKTALESKDKSTF